MTPDQINRLNGDRERPQVIELKLQVENIHAALERLAVDVEKLCTIPGFSLPGATMTAATGYHLNAAANHALVAITFLSPNEYVPTHGYTAASLSMKGQADA